MQNTRSQKIEKMKFNCKHKRLKIEENSSFKKTGQIFWIIVLVFITGFAFDTSAQTFDEARKLAFGGQREKAREICRAILADDFNSDVALLMGRTYAWDGKYDSARFVFNQVLQNKPNNEEAFGALADVEYWSENYSKAIEYCDKLLELDPVENSYVLKKARILNSSEDFDGAVSLLEDFLKNNRDDGEILVKLKEYRVDAMKNNIRINYTIDFFDGDFNRDPWQITSLSYGRKTKIGTVIGRINYANRFEKKGFQGEIDAYPKLGENSYGYLNYGFSDAGIFPKNRFGAEWYRNFPNAFEGSLGMRYLDFGGSGVDIYTATFGKYLGNYWISARSFVVPDATGTSVSGQLHVRRYFSDPENYLGLRLGYGVSPDENRNLIDSKQRITLKTRSVRCEFNHLFHHRWILNAAAVVGGEELPNNPGRYSGFYTLDVSVSRLF